MTYEILDSSDMIFQLLGERQSFSNQARYPLPHRAIESLYMVGFATLFVDYLMLFLWYYSLIRLPIIRVESRFLSVNLWD